MGGTFARFQGWPLRDLQLTRTRGYAANGAQMILFARDFPAGFDFTPPAPGQLAQAVPPPASEPLPGDRQGVAPVAMRLSYEGWLEVAEAVNGEEWRLPPIRLFVTGVETVRRADGSDLELVRVTAVDERFFWDHGRLRRWSFNRRRADGTTSLDSVGANGAPVTRKAIAEQVCGALFRSPKLSACPAEWSSNTNALEFPPNGAPVLAIGELVRTSDLEEPCLRLDGTVALHRAGEGMVGYAEHGRGPNTRAFPPQLLLYKDGAGQGSLVELGYPEDYVTIAGGGPRVATVAIDDLEPVVVIQGVVFVLNDENVRFLTSRSGGKPRDLAWLRRFVFASPEWAGAADLPEPVAEAFRTQASASGGSRASRSRRRPTPQRLRLSRARPKRRATRPSTSRASGSHSRSSGRLPRRATVRLVRASPPARRARGSFVSPARTRTSCPCSRARRPAPASACRSPSRPTPSRFVTAAFAAEVRTPGSSRPCRRSPAFARTSSGRPAAATRSCREGSHSRAGQASTS